MTRFNAEVRLPRNIEGCGIIVSQMPGFANVPGRSVIVIRRRRLARITPALYRVPHYLLWLPRAAVRLAASRAWSRLWPIASL